MPSRLRPLLRAPMHALRGLADSFNPAVWRRRGLMAGGATALVALAVVLFVLGWWWSSPPDTFQPEARAQRMAEAEGQEMVPGYVTTATLIHSVEDLLHKPGGYLFNDVIPPGVMLDNVPSWEYGAVVQIRDLARNLRNEMSRSQSQSREDPDLAQAEPRLHFNADAWMFPSTEGEYEAALTYLRKYRDRLAAGDADFYARADNLRDYLGTVGQRLGGIVQRLSASSSDWRADFGVSAKASNQPPAKAQRGETPWFEIDDEFYNARGATWALLHFLQAVRADFRAVLENKNAVASMDQLIGALEAAQRPLSSPLVLNGNGLGIFANHSLVLASYVARANASLIELRRLLEQG